MGKKNRRISIKSSKSQVTELCNELMQLCSIKWDPASSASQFRSMLEICKKLIVLQKDSCFVSSCLPTDREPHLIRLLEHYKQAIGGHRIAVCSDMKTGLGLQSLDCIEKNDCILQLPLASVFSVERVSNSLPSFLKSDPLFAGMPNVALSLALLHEVSLLEASKWHKYICSLPSTYTTVAYFTEADFDMLSGFPAADAVVNALKNVCRQYAYFNLLFDRMRVKDILPGYMENFTFEDYRWATATVMSRNNWLPQPGDPEKKQLCLIPLWDMINHRSGEVTTDFDSVNAQLVFYAMEFCGPNEEIFMDYGKRTSTEFLIYSGFVPEQNPHHKVPVKLGLSKFDKLFDQRNRLIQQFGFKSQITSSVSSGQGAFIPSELLCFARIFVMKEDELRQAEHELTTSDDHSNSFFLSEHLSNSRIDAEAGKFLHNRLSLLMKAFQSRLQKQLVGGELNELSTIGRHCMRACQHDVQVLSDCLASLPQP